MNEQPSAPGEQVTEPVVPVATVDPAPAAPPVPTEPAPGVPAALPPAQAAAPPPPAAAPPPPVYTWDKPVEETGPAPGVRFAGYGARLVAYIVDGIVVGAATVVATVVLSLVIAAFSSSGSDTAAALSSLLLVVVVLLIGIGYFPYFWARSGQTPGMRVLRIRVVRDRDGGPVGGGQAVLRFIGYIINSLVFYLGWIWIFVDRRRRGWHDLIAGTVVIEA